MNTICLLEITSLAVSFKTLSTPSMAKLQNEKEKKRFSKIVKEPNHGYTTN